MFMGINLSQSDDDVARQHRRSRVGHRDFVTISTVTSVTLATTAATFTSIAGTFIPTTMSLDITPTKRNTNAHHQCLACRVVRNMNNANATIRTL